MKAAPFEFLLSRGFLKKFRMLQLIRASRFDFLGKAKLCITASLVIIFLGGYFFVKGKDNIYGIDFTGGQIQEYKFSDKVNLEELRVYLSAKGLQDFDLYNYSSQDTVAIKTSEDTYKTVKEALKEKYEGKYELLKVDKVGPIVGKLLRRKALLAIISAIIGILLYTTFRFKHFEFGIAAVMALFHDVLVASAFLLFFSYKIDLLIVTALLTIAGYSINDTIVIYDRVRELSLKLSKQTLPQVINAAINQTLSRTVITSLTTILVVICLFFFGSENLKGFSFSLLVGFIAGIYSTIFIASPLVILLRRK